MQYLHGCEPPIVHRDLKTLNLLIQAVGDKRVIKVCFPQEDHQVLTRDGFRDFDDFRSALKRGESVSVACPVRRDVSDPLDQLALEYHDLCSMDALIDESTLELVEMRSQPTSSSRCPTKGDCEQVESSSSDNMDLLLTPEHQLPVSLVASSEADAPFGRYTARQVLDARAERAGFVCYAVHGVSDPTPQLPLPFAVALGLSTEDEVDAFVELYGYWLGNGTLTVEGVGAVTFTSSESAEVEYLEELLSRLPLHQLPSSSPLDRAGFTRRNVGSELAGETADLDSGEDEEADVTSAHRGNGSCVYRIRQSTWFRYFSSEYDHLYRASSPTRSGLSSTSFSSAEKQVWWWVWERLCARRLRLLLRGLRFASGDQKSELDAQQRIQSTPQSAANWEAALPLTSACIYTASARCREDYLHIALRAGFSATASVADTTNLRWQVAYEADGVRPHLVINPSEATAAKTGVPQPKEVNLLRLTEPKKVWCVRVPTADHLIIVRRVKRDSDGVIVESSRPTVVGNCDFGLARNQKNNDGISTQHKDMGTPCFQSPEQWRDDEEERLTEKTDVYSFGGIVLEVLTDRIPWHEEKSKYAIYQHVVVERKGPPISSGGLAGGFVIPPMLIDLIRWCQTYEPEKRPSFPEILRVLREVDDNLPPD